ncbi:DUF4302 domain-containing protein [Pedobacter sp. BS3]|uniref:DUF4302 domain-containing protein n=1 Tax=Pedobacter sp. BS3 TaxID=2567937 RepID=UPI00165902F4|nr:DUF4302 domain-containing protein [Pedobacter sp. BS3]
MKKLIYIMLALFGFIAGCKKDEDPIFDDPDTRLAAALADHQAELLSASNGWKATIYPKGGKGFFYYFKFTADGKVTMLSDFNTTTATTPKESTYRLKALQRPTLIFDTYNYIHLIADPDANVSGGSNATGLTSDFEFAFTGSSGDSLKFEGTFNKNAMVMVKLSSAEEQNILGGGIKKILDESTLAVSGKILYIMLNNKQVPVSMSMTGKSFSIAGQSSSPFSFTLDGLELKTPVTYSGITFNKVYWNASGKYFYLLNGTTEIKIEISPSPLPLDITPALHTVIKTRWTSMRINVADLPDLSADFMTKYNTANASLGTYQNNAGRYIEYINILFNADGTVTFEIRYKNPASPSSYYLADFIYNMTLNTTTGIARFTLAAAPTGNANTIKSYVTALTDYFANNDFKIVYISAAAPAGSTVGGFLSQNDPSSFFYGILLQ